MSVRESFKNSFNSRNKNIHIRLTKKTHFVVATMILPGTNCIDKSRCLLPTCHATVYHLNALVVFHNALLYNLIHLYMDTLTFPVKNHRKSGFEQCKMAKNRYS